MLRFLEISLVGCVLEMIMNISKVTTMSIYKYYIRLFIQNNNYQNSTSTSARRARLLRLPLIDRVVMSVKAEVA